MWIMLTTDASGKLELRLQATGCRLQAAAISCRYTAPCARAPRARLELAHVLRTSLHRSIRARRAATSTGRPARGCRRNTRVPLFARKVFPLRAQTELIRLRAARGRRFPHPACDPSSHAAQDAP